MNKKEMLRLQRVRYKKSRPWMVGYLNAQKRCNCPKNISYRYYGARGIKFRLTRDECEELWFRDEAYLLKRPSIDRINSKGDYIKDNCRFIEWSLNSVISNRERREAKLKLQKKFCPQCKQMKSFREFRKDNSRGDSLAGWCRECKKAKTHCQVQSD